MGLVFATQGRLAEATVVQERALAICRELGDRRNEAILLANLGGARLGLGDLGRAREALDAAVGLCREIGAHYPEGTALQLLAQVEEEAGDAARAQALLEESLARWRRLGHAGTVADSLLRLAAILAESGEADAASAALEEALGLARGEGLARAIAIGLGLRARLQGGDGAEAREALAAAGDWDAAYSVRFDLWKATGDRADLAAAKQGLDRRLAVNPPEFHEGMRTNIRLNREILAACKAERIA
jgi:tetratricopeptide (TPR) repeat protein